MNLTQKILAKIHSINRLHRIKTMGHSTNFLSDIGPCKGVVRESVPCYKGIFRPSSVCAKGIFRPNSLDCKRLLIRIAGGLISGKGIRRVGLMTALMLSGISMPWAFAMDHAEEGNATEYTIGNSTVNANEQIGINTAVNAAEQATVNTTGHDTGSTTEHVTGNATLNTLENTTLNASGDRIRNATEARNGPGETPQLSGLQGNEQVVRMSELNQRNLRESLATLHRQLNDHLVRHSTIACIELIDSIGGISQNANSGNPNPLLRRNPTLPQPNLRTQRRAVNGNTQQNANSGNPTLIVNSNPVQNARAQEWLTEIIMDLEASVGHTTLVLEILDRCPPSHFEMLLQLILGAGAKFGQKDLVFELLGKYGIGQNGDSVTLLDVALKKGAQAGQKDLVFALLEKCEREDEMILERSLYQILAEGSKAGKTNFILKVLEKYGIGMKNYASEPNVVVALECASRANQISLVLSLLDRYGPGVRCRYISPLFLWLVGSKNFTFIDTLLTYYSKGEPVPVDHMSFLGLAFTSPNSKEVMRFILMNSMSTAINLTDWTTLAYFMHKYEQFLKDENIYAWVMRDYGMILRRVDPQFKD